MTTEDEIRALKERHSATLLATPGVSGVGIEKNSTGDYVLVVHIDNAAARDQLPERLEGHEVRYVVSGPFKKLVR